jgi:hypothetical protein
MNTPRILRNAFISVTFLLPLTQLLTAASFTTFDVPGAVNGTFPSSINSAAVITGYFNDENFVSHGFLRGQNGTIITFDVPGAANGTFPNVINSAGVVAGIFADENFLAHGFIRAQNGAITTFDVPEATGGFFFLSAINPVGTIIGSLFDENFLTTGFVRAQAGNIITIDIPSAVNGSQAVAINPTGVVAGTYTDADFVSHGFLRANNGALTTFDPPAPGFMEPFAQFSFGPLLSITPQGVIAGSYFEPNPGNPFGGNFRVFVRATDGAFTTFDAATYEPCCIWSFPSGINPAGTITGSFNDGFTINHGFVRTNTGSITTFDVPGAGTGFNQGTAPLGITSEGVVMGLYIDSTYGYHGFLRLP